MGSKRKTGRTKPKYSRGLATPRGARAQVTREKLMSAALDCIVDLGYRGATMDEVVARASLSRGAQMHHFPTKLSLVDAAFSFMLDGLIDDVRTHTDLIRERREQPEELFTHLWKTYFSGRVFSVTMEIVVASRSDSELKALAAATSDRFHRALDDCWYILCRNRAIVGNRLILLLNLTVTLLRGMGFQKVLWDRPDYFSELLNEWLAITAKIFDLQQEDKPVRSPSVSDQNGETS